MLVRGRRAADRRRLARRQSPRPLRAYRLSRRVHGSCHPAARTWAPAALQERHDARSSSNTDCLTPAGQTPTTARPRRHRPTRGRAARLGPQAARWCAPTERRHWTTLDRLRDAAQRCRCAGRVLGTTPLPRRAGRRRRVRRASDDDRPTWLRAGRRRRTPTGSPLDDRADEYHAARRTGRVACRAFRPPPRPPRCAALLLRRAQAVPRARCGVLPPPTAARAAVAKQPDPGHPKPRTRCASAAGRGPMRARTRTFAAWTKNSSTASPSVRRHPDGRADQRPADRRLQPRTEGRARAGAHPLRRLGDRRRRRPAAGEVRMAARRRRGAEILLVPLPGVSAEEMDEALAPRAATPLEPAWPGRSTLPSASSGAWKASRSSSRSPRT
ncbi:MAG: hypothetical protein MZW92_35070 [Comamonadaceae bacterium]|nr:hypothetical protein [Comamonadaceae bacterium]